MAEKVVKAAPNAWKKQMHSRPLSDGTKNIIINNNYLSMETEEMFNNLKRSRTVIANYVELDSRIWQLQYNARHYNRKRLFNIIGIAAAVLMTAMLTSGPDPTNGLGLIIYMAPLTFVFFRFAVGDVLDYFKRKTIIREIRPEIQKLSSEMNHLADKLENFSVLPERYRTLQAVDAIGNYLVNKRADSLKEAINLYEDELFKHKQLQNQQFQIQQNSHMIQQNREMIKAQKVTNSRLLWV